MCCAEVAVGVPDVYKIQKNFWRSFAVNRQAQGAQNRKLPSFSTLSFSYLMSFRKRNIVLTSNTGPLQQSQKASTKSQLPGCKPSPVDGRTVTSTGTATLDRLLAGHGGHAVGCSILIEENGTTDYSGALLKFFAAEGLLQGHHVHVLGLPEQWGRELPGAVAVSDTKDKGREKNDKMKIAWRYETLGQFGSSPAGTRGRFITEVGCGFILSLEYLVDGA
jgi:hypothetical protein